MQVNGTEVVTQIEFSEFKQDFSVTLTKEASRAKHLLTLMSYSCVTLALTSVLGLSYMFFK